MVNDWIIFALIILGLWDSYEIYKLKKKVNEQEDPYDESGTAENY